MSITLERAVEADEIVTALRGYGFTQADVAQAVGVSDRAVRNWGRDTTLQRGCAALAAKGRGEEGPDLSR